MNSSTSNAEQAVSFDFLVKVSGDKLKLQHNLLQSLLVPYTDSEVPVAIVSVIGQPKSRKTLLTNFIQKRIISLVDVDTERKQFGAAVASTSGFPRSLDDCPNKSARDKLDGQEGVLIWTKPCLVQQKDGQSLAVFILDIWSENPTPSLYTRLVDFCITSSSVVILVEDCCTAKESNWNQWDTSKSFLDQLKGREFQNLHVLIHANWEEENFHTLGLEGGKLFMNARKDQFSDRLSRVVDTGHILRGYFKDTSYFLAPVKSESTVQNDKIPRSDKDHIRGLLEFSHKVVGYDPSKLFPLARNKTVLSTLSVNSHFQNGIVISNSGAAVTKATDATVFQPNNIEVEMELCEDTSGSAEVQTPSQLDSQKSSTSSQANLDINKEEEMAQQASCLAEEYYNKLIKSKISETCLTDSEVRTFHEVCVKASLGTFLEVSEFKSSFVWTRCGKELKDRLHMYLPNYLKENQPSVDRVQRTKKNLMSDCTKVYNDSMNKLIADRVISDKILRSHHDRSFEEVLQILNVRMNSITEKFDKSSWANELAEKLRTYFNAFSDENNRKIQNEAKNHQPAAAASADYGNATPATSTQSCGVGIYFGPDIVRLGIYLNAQTNLKYLKFSPFVTFERNGIVFFNRHSSHHDHFDVYKTLVQEKNFPRTVFVSGKSYPLWTEEIVAVFLNKIKSEAETKFGFVITSCAVAVSAFMSTSSKQMLKTALTLAGFERNTIIQSTTAAGLSYVVTNRVIGNGPATFIHQSGSVFDVASAVINQRSISIRYISGLPYLEKSSGWFWGSQDTLSRKVKKLISSTIASSEFSAWQLRAQVMVQGEENFISDNSAITESLLGRSLMTIDEAQGIVFGAAAFNAFQNKIPGAPNLEYSEVFPYTVLADVNGQQITRIVRHNMPVISKNMSISFPVTEVWSSKKVRIVEFAVENEKIIVGEYTINARNSKSRNFVLCVNFNSEGLIEVEAKTAYNLRIVPVEIRTQALTMAQQCSAVENLRPILIQAATSTACLPWNVSTQTELKQKVEANSGAVENEMTSPLVIAQDPKAKLVDVITDVKDRLAKSTVTNPMIATRINERIKQCEELLGKDDVHEKQIEMQIKLLDLAAAKIK